MVGSPPILRPTSLLLQRRDRHRHTPGDTPRSWATVSPVGPTDASIHMTTLAIRGRSARQSQPACGCQQGARCE